MKNRFIPSLFFYLTLGLSLFLFACGDTEDVEEATNSTHNMLFDAPDELWENLEDKDWEEVKGENWVRLTDEEVAEFMNLEIPQRWGFETKDRALL